MGSVEGEAKSLNQVYTDDTIRIYIFLRTEQKS